MKHESSLLHVSSRNQNYVSGVSVVQSKQGPAVAVTLKHVTDNDVIAEQHLEALAQGAKCLDCPLYKSGRGPVSSELRPGTKALLIGQEPGTQEIRDGKPFVGPSGAELARALGQAGCSRDDVSIVNVINCQPPTKLGMDRYLKQCKDRGLPSPIDCCAPRLVKEIEASGATALITLGAYAMESVAKLYKIPIGGRKQKPGDLALATITQQRGHPLALPDGKVLMPTIHPAYALRSAKQMLQPIRDDIAKGVKIGLRGHIHNPEPAYLIKPTLQQVLLWCDYAVQTKAQVTVDIETDGLAAEATIRCIGFGIDAYDGGTLTESIICIPFVLRNGSLYWESKEDYDAALDSVMNVLAECPLVLHNGAYDSKVLLHHGWLKDRYKLWDDTLLAHHNSREVECLHKLSFVSTRFGEFPMWKTDVDHKSLEANEEDDDYWLYNAKDVRTTLIAWRGLQRWLTEDETWPQYEMEKHIARIYRDVGELGWYIDEAQRQDLSKQIHIRVDTLRTKLRALVGDAWKPGKRCAGKRKKAPEHTCDDCLFNPNSHVQVAWYLYEHLGLTPPMNAKGRKWEPDDEYTTGAPVLLALIDHGVDEHTFKFIDTLVIYKSAEKLRSSYIDAFDPKKDRSKNTKKPVDLRPSAFPGLYHLRVSWNAAGTDSGRLSSNPNVQNIPSRTSLNIKTMFVAPPGHVLVKGDFDQIELRIFAALSKDEVMIKGFLSGADVHSLNAATVYSEIEKKSVDEIYQWLEGGGASPEQRDLYRTTIKQTIFGKSYGATDKKLYQIMASSRDKATNERLLPYLQKMPRHEAEALVKKVSTTWDKSHPWMKKFQDSLFEEEQQQWYLAEPVTGRRRYLPNGANSPGVTLNIKMQSGAAALANIAVIKIDKAIPHKSWSPYSGVVCQVHDEIVVCVPEEKVGAAMTIMRECMTNELSGIPITATPEACRRWSGPLCSCGALKKSHKKKLPKGCTGFTPKDSRLDAEIEVL